MPTAFPKLFGNLTRPFPQGDYWTLRLDDGRDVWFLPADMLIARLDAVFGPERWHDEYAIRPRSVVCRLTLLLPDGRRVGKIGVGALGSRLDQPRPPDAAGCADALRSACLKWGIGRKVTYGIKSPLAVPRQVVQDDAPCDPAPPVDSGHVPPTPDATQVILDALARPPANLPDFLDFLHRVTKATGLDCMRLYLRWHILELIPGPALAMPAELIPAAFDYIVTRLREDAIP